MQQLQLRPEHMAVMAAARERDFRHRLVAFVRTSFASSLQHVEEAELERRVDVGIRRAKQHMLSTECAISGFVNLMFLLGPRYDEHPKVKRALNNFARKDYDRLGVLARKLTSDDWRAVLRRSTATSWHGLS